MQRGKNFNHPKRGDRIKVEPIKDIEAIKRIKLYLKDKPRDLALFTLGINTSLRASDLLRISAGQVRHVKSGDDLEIVEKKTRKPKRITLNNSCTKAIKKLLGSREYQDHEPLFIGQRGPLTVPYINRLLKSWCRTVGLKGNYGSHTLRKTFGFHQRKTFKLVSLYSWTFLTIHHRSRQSSISAFSQRKSERFT